MKKTFVQIISLCFLIVSGWVGLPPLSVYCQEAGDADSAEGISFPPIEEMSPEAVQSRIDRIESSEKLEDDLRAGLLNCYTATLAHIRSASRWRSSIEELEKTRQLAPGVIESIKRELAEEEPESFAPEVSREAPFDELDQALSRREADLAGFQQEIRDLEEEVKLRDKRRLQLPGLLSAAKERLAEVRQELVPSAVSSEDLPDVLRNAKSISSEAEKAALEEEIKAHETELAVAQLRDELLRNKRDRAARKLTAAEESAVLLRGMVNDRRREEAERAAMDARRAATNAHPAVKLVAEENARLAEMRTGPDGLAATIEKVALAYESIDAEATHRQERYNALRHKIRAAGLTKVIGVVLRKEKADLPDLRRHRRDVAERQSEIDEVQLQLIQWEEMRSSLSDIDSACEEILDGMVSLPTGRKREDIAGRVKELLQTRRDEYLDALIDEGNIYFTKLIELDLRERQFISGTETFTDYINEHILWFCSCPALKISDIADAVIAALWFLNPSGLQALAASFLPRLGEDVEWWLAVFLFFVLILSRKKLEERIRETGIAEEGSSWNEFSYTLRAVVGSIFLSVIFPGLLWILGWHLLSKGAGGNEFVLSVGHGMKRVAAVFFFFQLLRTLCDEDGAGVLHLGWDRDLITELRGLFGRVMAVVLPAVFVITALEFAENEAWSNSLGRIVFIVLMVCCSILASRLFRPGKGLFSSVVKRSRGEWLKRFAPVWYWAAVAISLLLAGIAAWGYYYTALILSRRLFLSLWLAIGVFLMYALLARWLLIAGRRIARERFRKRREKARVEARDSSPEPEDGEVPLPSEDAQPKLFTMRRQTRQLIRIFAAIVLALGLWQIWSDLTPALSVLKRVEIWSSQTVAEERSGPSDFEQPLGTGPGAERPATAIGEPKPITLDSLFLAAGVIALTVLAVKNVPGLLEMVILERLPLTFGVHFAIVTISRYLIIVIGTVVAFNSVGIGWARVQWLVAALTVGLGFGLQEIFANFVSGLIILFERPIRVGDTVSLGDVTGTVSRIRIRATTIITWERRELVVPNREFITGRLINWTLSDTILRQEIQVGLAYGSDTELAHRLLLRIADENPVVLKDPKPSVLFRRFGENSLEFELRVFLPDIQHYFTVAHDIHMDIDREFRKAKITIAFPQLDLHISPADRAVSGLIQDSDERDKTEGE